MGAAGIERKTLHCPGTAETADVRFCFKDNNPLAPFMQKAGKGETGKAAAKNRSCHAIIMGTLDLNG